MGAESSFKNWVYLYIHHKITIQLQEDQPMHFSLKTPGQILSTLSRRWGLTFHRLKILQLVSEPNTSAVNLQSVSQSLRQ